MTTAKEKKALLKAVEKLKNEIAAKRDELRGLIEEWSDIVVSCEDAENSLESAIDAISRHL